MYFVSHFGGRDIRSGYAQEREDKQGAVGAWGSHASSHVTNISKKQISVLNDDVHGNKVESVLFDYESVYYTVKDL